MPPLARTKTPTPANMKELEHVTKFKEELGKEAAMSEQELQAAKKAAFEKHVEPPITEEPEEPVESKRMRKFYKNHLWTKGRTHKQFFKSHR